MSVIRVLQINPSTTVEIEAVDRKEPGADFAGRDVSQRLVDNIDDIAESVRAICTTLHAKLSDIKATELSFGFGLALTAQGGMLIVSGSATANFSVSMRFSA
jgi:hypothetical protein